MMTYVARRLYYPKQNHSPTVWWTINEAVQNTPEITNKALVADFIAFVSRDASQFEVLINTPRWQHLMFNEIPEQDYIDSFSRQRGKR